MTSKISIVVQDLVIDTIVDIAVVIVVIILRRSHRIHKQTISNDYVVYLSKHEFITSMSLDLASFKVVIVSPQLSY